MLNEWQKLTVSPEVDIKTVIEVINNSAGAQIALVVDTKNRLLGTITDGDLRRRMLRGLGLEGNAGDAMCEKYVSTLPGTPNSSALILMREYSLRQIPIVDQNKFLHGIILQNELIDAPRRHNSVVIMAGGRGKRLAPLTDSTPKPMLLAGGKPMLETILEKFITQGFVKFYFAINYLGGQICDHFGDGKNWNVKINYLRERKPLGTAGSLHMLDRRMNGFPIIVCNADILTNLYYPHLLEFHHRCKSQMTACVKSYQHEIPFGVVQVENERLTAIVEKPVVSHLVSAGIYVLNPSVINRLIADSDIDMPELISHLLENKIPVSCFPLHEDWIDVGSSSQLDRVNLQHSNIFT